MQNDEKVYVLTTMAQYPAAYANELRGLKQETLTWKPSDREWSLAEVIAHLADTEENYLRERLTLIIQKDRPVFRGFDQEAWAAERRYNEQDPMANLARFAKANAAIMALAWSIPDQAWERTGIHSEAGEMTFAEALMRLATHQHSHLNQMRRVKFQYLRAGRQF